LRLHSGRREKQHARREAAERSGNGPQAPRQSRRRRTPAA
jgi:hypothetical protein